MIILSYCSFINAWSSRGIEITDRGIEITDRGIEITDIRKILEFLY
jgi:hypothetical protein